MRASVARPRPARHRNWSIESGFLEAPRRSERVGARATMPRVLVRMLLERLGLKEAPMLKVQDKAPAFAALDQDGKTVKLSDFAGKRVVLWFYPKADTPG
jgi:hypothetical protein